MYRFTLTIFGIKIKDEIRKGTPKIDLVGFLKEMKKLGVKTSIGGEVITHYPLTKEGK